MLLMAFVMFVSIPTVPLLDPAPGFNCDNAKLFSSRLSLLYSLMNPSTVSTVLESLSSLMISSPESLLVVVMKVKGLFKVCAILQASLILWRQSNSCFFLPNFIMLSSSLISLSSWSLACFK
eukprot:TRINITY_DN10825_c0_g3_i1.p1 TRINITY_DN10825_c0_g3~~TRINITY_DN10825_c0_g3_i1.p1  ORF type:complete len:122 (+),score=3.20 TRINITY_DN10825_c0_g3_i1:518-883(+)